jgi:hypothetical protein
VFLQGGNQAERHGGFAVILAGGGDENAGGFGVHFNRNLNRNLTLNLPCD